MVTNIRTIIVIAELRLVFFRRWTRAPPASGLVCWVTPSAPWPPGSESKGSGKKRGSELRYTGLGFRYNKGFVLRV